MNLESGKTTTCDNDTSMKNESELSEEEAHKDLGISWFQIWMLGITIVIGGQYFCWNVGLQAGFGSCIISVILIGLAYICMCLGNAELTSALPFAGGAYGLARVTLGLYPGFIVGACESVEYIVYVASSSMSLAAMIAELSGTSTDLVPVYCLVFYVIAVTLTLMGGRAFWWTSTALGVVSLGIVVVYCLGSLPWVSMTRNAPTMQVTGWDDGVAPNQWFIGGMGMFMKVLPLAPWFYVGVESLNMCSSVVDNPRETIPKASILCILTLFVTSIFIACVVPALPPDPSEIVATSLAPFNNGFHLMFNIDPVMATAISIPATFATAYGFVYAFSRVMIAMARSGLYPPLLKRTWGRYQTPYVSVLVGSVLGYALVIAVYLRPEVFAYLYNICIMSAFMAYTSQAVGYVVFKLRYPDQERKFVSPVGIPGAVFSGVVFTVAFVGVVAFQDDQQVAFASFVVLLCLYTVYYFGYAKKRQYFSPEEKFIFLVHIVKFNERARMLATRGRKSSKGSSSGSYLSEKAKYAFGDSGRAMSIAFGEIARKSSISISGIRYGRSSSVVAVSGPGGGMSERGASSIAGSVAGSVAEDLDLLNGRKSSSAPASRSIRWGDSDRYEGTAGAGAGEVMEIEAAARADSKAFEA